ncbi:hypothetical protein ACU686_36985 [Yinghuangia aomiensis]
MSPPTTRTPTPEVPRPTCTRPAASPGTCHRPRLTRASSTPGTSRARSSGEEAAYAKNPRCGFAAPAGWAPAWRCSSPSRSEQGGRPRSPRKGGFGLAVLDTPTRRA